jgi:uncharacterized protein (TIGR00369 family)
MDTEGQRERFREQGYARLLGLEFDHAESGFVRLRLLVSEIHLQSVQTVHGGILATLGDACSAQALLTLLEPEESFASIELKINYLSPARAGDTLVGEGRIIRRGGRIALGDMEIKNEATGRLIAKGLHTFMILRNES